jgi:hypothetical protein
VRRLFGRARFAEIVGKAGRETADSRKIAGALSSGAELTASAASLELREVQALLVVLSVTAGCTDIISFLGLNGLFTAHLTGNLVILAAHFFSGQAQIAPMLSVPVFIVVISLTRVLASSLELRGLVSLQPLLLLQFLLLAGFPSCLIVAGAEEALTKMAYPVTVPLQSNQTKVPGLDEPAVRISVTTEQVNYLVPGPHGAVSSPCYQSKH